MNRKRRDEESFEEYKDDLKYEERKVKQYLTGAIFHNSKAFGTYRKRKEIKIHEKTRNI